VRARRWPALALSIALFAAACTAGDDSSSTTADDSTTTSAPLFADEITGPPARECADWLGEPVPGTAKWNQADRNNQTCAVEGLRIMDDNPAVDAAVAANAAAGEGHFSGDPFRAPHRWAGERGRYELTTYTDREGNTWPAALFGPSDADAGPYPGVLLVCHACIPLPQTTEHVAVWYWAAQALAEAGYVVLYAMVGGNSVPRAEDAAAFFTATPAASTGQGEFNPWHRALDRRRLGIIGHSGAAGVALAVGSTDTRFDAIVAWDPASSGTLSGVAPTTPTMLQLADYSLSDGAVPRPEPPTPEPGSKYTYFDTIRDAGVDVMQVTVRASTHIDWTRATGGLVVPQFSDLPLTHSIYGEMVATYYTLAWLDRYVAGESASPSDDSESAATDDPLRRLTASGREAFDTSADVHSIGAGFYDPDAARAANAEGGNIPIEIAGIPIANLLSFQYPSRYFLDRGAARCNDMRAGCEPAAEAAPVEVP